MTYAGYVLRHLAARPLRATLTAGAFAFSIGLLGFLWLLAAALQKEWSPYMAQRVMVTAKTSFFERRSTSMGAHSAIFSWWSR